MLNSSGYAIEELSGLRHAVSSPPGSSLNQGQLHIGFVSTRLSGTDGVSLEVDKWVEVLEGLGHKTFCFAGESDWDDDKSWIVDEAHFKHPDIQDISEHLFSQRLRNHDTAKTIRRIKEKLHKQLHKFVDHFRIDLLIVENAWSLPMNVPLGMALTEMVGDTRIPAIGHHHDFWWDRQRFLGAPVDDYLGGYFPTTFSWIKHVVINSLDRRELSFRHGVSTSLIPNVMHFEDPPDNDDDYASDLRDELEIPDDHYLLLQPTRIVPRKQIEKSIELVKYVDKPCTIVITHEAGDEGMEYKKYIQKFAGLLDVDVRFADDRFDQNRHEAEDGTKIYSLADAYQQSDLVTYPSLIEGFGNAFLEAVYYKKPLVISNYEIFKLDIEPRGFQVIPIDKFITNDVVQKVEELLENPKIGQQQVETNFQLGLRHYSYRTLQYRLQALLDECMGVVD